MDIRSQLRSWLFPESSAHSPSWAAAAGYRPTRDSETGLIDPSPEALSTLSTVHAACQAISGALISSDWALIRQIETGGRTKASGMDAYSALLDLSIESRQAFLLDVLGGGEGFLAIRRNARGGVHALERIMPERVSVAVLSTGGIRYELAANKELALRAEVVPAEDMISLKFLTSRHSPHVGVSPLATLAPSLDVLIAVRDSARTLFRNSARINTVLTHPKAISPEATIRLKESFKQATTSWHSYEPIVLSEAMTVEQLSPATAMDLQLAELSRLSVKAVSQAYSVPISHLGDSENTSYASSAEQSRYFVRNCLRPWAHKLGDALSRGLLTREQRRSGYGVEINLEQMLRGDGKELSDQLSQLVNAGIMVGNEARNALGLQDIEGGDALRLPLNTGPFERWQDPNPEPEPEVEPEPEPEIEPEIEPEPEAKAKGLIAWLNRHDG